MDVGGKCSASWFGLVLRKLAAVVRLWDEVLRRDNHASSDYLLVFIHDRLLEEYKRELKRPGDPRMLDKAKVWIWMGFVATDIFPVARFKEFPNPIHLFTSQTSAPAFWSGSLETFIWLSISLTPPCIRFAIASRHDLVLFFAFELI